MKSTNVLGSSRRVPEPLGAGAFDAAVLSPASPAKDSCLHSSASLYLCEMLQSTIVVVDDAAVCRDKGVHEVHKHFLLLAKGSGAAQRWGI
jgi:hypothetical protein